MTEFLNTPPAFLLIIGSLIVPLLPYSIKRYFVILLPLLTFYQVTQFDNSAQFNISFAGIAELQFLNVDGVSKAFAYIFTLSAAAGMAYSFYLKCSTQHSWALAYVGSSLGVLFAGDLFSLYIFWELMAVTSTFLILSRKHETSLKAGMRYILVHIFGGLLLFAGILLHTKGYGGSVTIQALSSVTPASVLILAGMLINAAAWPFAAWLPDAYPSSSITAGIFLSAYTTKTAVYALLRVFPEWNILIVIGGIMAIYGVIYAVLENDFRRLLAYSIVNQVGFMVMAIGIGSNMALNGVIVHAFSHILYKSLLWMVAGSLIYRLGVRRFTEVSGLASKMPVTALFACIGALSIASFPLTSSFNSKAYLLTSVAEAHHFWAWLTLEIAASGIFIASGMKFVYYLFFDKPTEVQPKDAPNSMYIGMGFLAVLNLYLGLNPSVMLSLMPFPMEHTINTYSIGHILPHLQLLAFSALAFFLLKEQLRPKATLTLDTDFVYANFCRWIYSSLDNTLNAFNAGTHTRIVREFIPTLGRSIVKLPEFLSATFVRIESGFQAPGSPSVQLKEEQASRHTRTGTLPVGISALFALGLFLVLLIWK